jgi:septum formation protein
MNNPHLADLAERVGLVLGSGSPRRIAMLTEAGIPFRQISSTIDESRRNGEPPYEFAERLAREKALAVAGQVGSEPVVLGCDTIVVLGDTVLGKPSDAEEAFRHLSRLSGAEHVVCTAIALVRGTEVLNSDYRLTNVIFNEIRAEQMREYIATGEPLDKAGGYGIQGMGAFLVDYIEGPLDNVIGLPRELLDDMAKKTLTRLSCQ